MEFIIAAVSVGIGWELRNIVSALILYYKKHKQKQKATQERRKWECFRQIERLTIQSETEEVAVR